jgi:hypothetical protein
MAHFEDRRNEKRKEDRLKNKEFDLEGIERRKVRRVKGVVVEYRMHGSQEALKGAFLRDLSSGGISISVSEKINVDAILDIDIYITGVEHPVSVEAEVCWVKISEYYQDATKNHYDIGLKISSPEGEELDLIDEYVERYNLDSYESDYKDDDP